MASMGIFLIVTVIYISICNARKVFVQVECKSKTLGQYGQQTLLECVVKTAQNVADPTIQVVTWKKDGVEDPLLVFHSGKTKVQKGYSFAEPSWNDHHMNVSLLIANTAVEHNGSYTCAVMTDSGDDDNKTSLQVSAKYSKPAIHSDPETIPVNTGGTLICDSEGGYPEGRLRWFDEHNSEWTVSSEMEAKQTGSGLFHLSSKLTLQQRSIFSNYTCKVFNAIGGKEGEATFEVLNSPSSVEGQEQLPKESDPASRIVAPVVVIGSLIVGLLLALLIYRNRSKRDHHMVCTHERDVEEGDHQEMDKTCQDIVA